MAAAEKYLIEDKARLSESHIFELLREFYLELGIKAFQKSTLVPTFLTSNNFIARQYARLILGTLHDILHGDVVEVNRSEPVYIMELGAGSAKLSYLILRYLFEWEDQWPSSPLQVPFKFIITDLVESNVEYCRNHRCFAEFIQKGVCDFAILDAEYDHSITLLGPPGSAKQKPIRFFNNPVIFVANYFFDSLPHDAFRMQSGVLEECLLTMKSENSWEPDLRDYNLFKRCNLSWHYQLAIPETRYTGRLKDLGEILEWYALTFGEENTDASFHIPVGPFICLQLCRQLSGDRFVVISGDKCSTQEPEFYGLRDPYLAFNSSFSTFSLTANLHALLLWCDQKGGFAQCTTWLEGYKTCFFGMGFDESKMNQSLLAFDDINSYGPEAFSTIQRTIKKDISDIDLKMIMFLLRMSCHDSSVFYKFHPQIFEKMNLARNFPERVIEDLLQDLMRVYEYHYPLNPDKDVTSIISTILVTLKHYSQAVPILLDSIIDYGATAAKSARLGLVLFNINELQHAKEAFDVALSLDPNHQDSLNGLQFVKARMKEIEVEQNAASDG